MPILCQHLPSSIIHWNNLIHQPHQCIIGRFITCLPDQRALTRSSNHLRAQTIFERGLCTMCFGTNDVLWCTMYVLFRYKCIIWITYIKDPKTVQMIWTVLGCFSYSYTLPPQAEITDYRRAPRASDASVPGLRGRKVSPKSSSKTQEKNLFGQSRIHEMIWYTQQVPQWQTVSPLLYLPEFLWGSRVPGPLSQIFTVDLSKISSRKIRSLASAFFQSKVFDRVFGSQMTSGLVLWGRMSL